MKTDRVYIGSVYPTDRVCIQFGYKTLRGWNRLHEGGNKAGLHLLLLPKEKKRIKMQEKARETAR